MRKAGLPVARNILKLLRISGWLCKGERGFYKETEEQDKSLYHSVPSRVTNKIK
jgi:hypothetical protein